MTKYTERYGWRANNNSLGCLVSGLKSSGNHARAMATSLRVTELEFYLCKISMMYTVENKGTGFDYGVYSNEGHIMN